MEALQGWQGIPGQALGRGQGTLRVNQGNGPVVGKGSGKFQDRGGPGDPQGAAGRGQGGFNPSYHCLLCGEYGHWRRDCPRALPRPGVGGNNGPLDGRNPEGPSN